MPSGNVTIEEITDITPEVVEAIDRLIPQLSRTAPVPTVDQLTEIASAPATVFLAARSVEHGRIVGLLTLAVFRIPTGMRAWIEDVVVDESERGRGVGEVLTREALRRANSAGARTVELTSRPSRESANRLYRRLGFVERETNVYRHELG